jgi:hypothetical protein
MGMAQQRAQGLLELKVGEEKSHWCCYQLEPEMVKLAHYQLVEQSAHALMPVA